LELAVEEEAGITLVDSLASWAALD